MGLWVEFGYTLPFYEMNKPRFTRRTQKFTVTKLVFFGEVHE